MRAARTAAWLAGLVAGATACATAQSDPDAAQGAADAALAPPDAAPGTADAAPAPPDAAPRPPDAAGPVTVTLSHSTSDAIVAGNSVSCNNSTTNSHTDNSYWRVFDLPALGVTGPFVIDQVAFGVEEATAGSGGTQPATVRFYTLAGPLAIANLTLIGSTPVSIPNQTLTIFSAPVSGITVPAGATLAVEVFTPNGQAAGHVFFIGSNAQPEAAPTYLSAADCGVTEPTPTTDIGFPDMHIVLKVTGRYTP